MGSQACGLPGQEEKDIVSSQKRKSKDCQADAQLGAEGRGPFIKPLELDAAVDQIQERHVDNFRNCAWT